MNFEFSDDQLVMKEEVRKLFEKEDSVKRNRNILEGDENFDKDLWSKVVEMGLTAITIPEEHGGIGLGFLELCVVAEEMGRAIGKVDGKVTGAIKAVGMRRERAKEIGGPKEP